MADSLRVSDGEYCHCCLSKNGSKPLQFYNIRNQLLKIILQMENLSLCYVCKSLAEKTELFIRNVEMCQTIFDEMKHSRASIENSKERITPIYNLSKDNLQEIIEYSHKYDGEVILDTTVKIEDLSSDLTTDQLPEELAIEEYKSEHNPLIKQDLNTELNQSEYLIKEEFPECNDEGSKIFIVDGTDCKRTKRKMFEAQAKAKDQTTQQYKYENKQETEIILDENEPNEYSDDDNGLQLNEETDEFEDTVTNTPGRKRSKRKLCKDQRNKESKNEEDVILDEKTNNDYSDDGLQSETEEKESKRKQCNIKIIKLTLEQCMEERRKRSETENYKTAEFKCEHCILLFRIKKSFDDHNLREHSESSGMFECAICKRRYPNKDRLRHHYEGHLRRYKCSMCEFTRQGSSSVRDHYLSTHCDTEYYKYRCKLCPKKYKFHVSLSNHLKTTHYLESKFKCSECDKEFKGKNNLRLHIYRKHTKSGQERKFVCTLCGKGFLTKQCLTAHELVHTDRRDYYCVECDKGFKTESKLKMHLMRCKAHADQNNLPFKCSQCWRKFEKQKSLDSHYKEYHIKSKIKCQHCPKTFNDKSNHRRHVMRMHEKTLITPITTCKICQKQIKGGARCITDHMNTHSGQRPYTCKQCPATFTQSGSLHNHVKLVHLKIKRNKKFKNT